MPFDDFDDELKDLDIGDIKKNFYLFKRLNN